jgi:hypothetical protein
MRFSISSTTRSSRGNDERDLHAVALNGPPPRATNPTNSDGESNVRKVRRALTISDDPDGAVDVPVQFFQSVIAIELAVTGALLWLINFFDSDRTARRELPDTRLRILMALILGATLFGSLWAMVDEGGSRWPAIAVTIGLAISIIPILLRVLPPLARDAATSERDPGYGLTILGLVMYVGVVAGFLVLLDLD